MMSTSFLFFFIFVESHNGIEPMPRGLQSLILPLYEWDILVAGAGIEPTMLSL